MARNSYGFEERKRPKAVSLVEIIVVAVLAVAMIGVLLFSFLYSKDGTARKFFGNYIYLSNVSSMSPKIPVGSAVFADPELAGELIPGEAALCNVEYNDETYTTILRIQDIQQEGDTTYYILRGDTNLENEIIRLPQSAILAKCVSYSELLGAVLTFSTSPLGILTGIIVPCLLVIVIQVVRIVRLNKYEADEDDDEDFEIDDVVFSTRRAQTAPSEPPAIEPSRREEAAFQEQLPPEPPVKRLYVGEEGRAEYQRHSAPTGNYRELNETMRSGANPLRGQSAASRSLNTQRGTVSDNFKQKPVSRPPEAAEEIYFSRPRRPVQEEPLYERPRAYYERPSVPISAPLDPPAVKNPVDITIPAEAAIPKETIAPPPKQSNNKTVEELMRVIDQAQSGLRK